MSQGRIMNSLDYNYCIIGNKSPHFVTNTEVKRIMLHQIVFQENILINVMPH